MKFVQTPLSQAFIVIPEKKEDDRGFFARTFSADDFASLGLKGNFVQSSISFNPTKGTLRGMHYQETPYEEVRLVRCTSGNIYDVLVDLRPSSKTFKKSFGVELSAENAYSVYVPKGCAHGFITLTPNSEVMYWMTEVYHPEASKGVRFDDPAFGITWPTQVIRISERDKSFPNFY